MTVEAVCVQGGAGAVTRVPGTGELRAFLRQVRSSGRGPQALQTRQSLDRILTTVEVMEDFCLFFVLRQYQT